MTDTETYLREVREKRGLTLDDVVAATRIPRHYLNLMEGEGDSRLISDRLYLVHYIRQYAAHLQIEESEQLAAQFIRENNRLQGPQKNQTTQRERKLSPIVPWLLLLLLLVGAGAAYVYEPDLLTRILPEKVQKTPAITADPEVTEPAATASVTPIGNARTIETALSNTANDAVSVLQPEANEITPSRPELVKTASVDGKQTDSKAAGKATTTKPDPTALTTQGNPVSGNAAQPPKSTTAQPAQVVTIGQRLEIVAREKSWVRVIADGQRPQDMMMEPGDSRAWSAEKQFVLTFGNAGGVDLTLNGKKLSPLGTSGQVIRNYQLPKP